MASIPSSASAANDGALVAGVIRKLPRTDAELSEAHQTNEASACEPVPAGQPIEMPGFRHHVAYQVESVGSVGKPVRRRVEFEAGRLPVLAAAAQMTLDDQSNLPLISGGKILECVNKFYIAVEVRVHRRGPDGVPHLFYRPFGVVAAYNDPSKTQDFVDLVRASVRDFRGIGLFLKPGEPATPETLRTLVIVNKNTLAQADAPGGELQMRPN
ncbi:MAG TPA: hypothetical protein VHV77_08375, partial [Pirellulales bacterium]|nr:hypothetical protein [Pirellulales bacterium]